MPGANIRLDFLLAYLGLEQDKLARAAARQSSQSDKHEIPSTQEHVFRSGNFIPYITQLTLDSRETNANTLFLAIFGHKQKGHDFLPQVALKGCVLALLETHSPSEHVCVELRQFNNGQAVLCIHVFELAKELANIAQAFYMPNPTIAQFWPHITAITGTNGKTSVASLTAQLASLCNIKSASIGTLGLNIFVDGQTKMLGKTINTTPDVIQLFSHVAELAQLKCKVVCLEASSHGLEQNRLKNLPIHCGVFTNLSQDHLDYHQNMQAYAAAKRKLLVATGLSILVLNADDEESVLWQQQAKSSLSVYWYSQVALDNDQQGCWASDISYSTAGVSFTLHVNIHLVKQELTLSSPLIGPFNVANLLAALTALIAQGIDFTALCSALSKLSGVAGRMELFTSNKASMLVDYAHTPDALKQALIAARTHTKGKLICIFGCGGDRDKSKRALMGGIAEQYADLITLTQDNSRSEPALTIIGDIQKGISPLSLHTKVKIDLDRKRAIFNAWQQSQKEDMILIAGKGHEDYVEINGERIDYNEREYVLSIVNDAKHYDNYIDSKEDL